VALFAANGDVESLRAAEQHRDVVRRFGRFPHRNAIVGRPSMMDWKGTVDGGSVQGTAVRTMAGRVATGSVSGVRR
jgi:hypothetical protein